MVEPEHEKLRLAMLTAKQLINERYISVREAARAFQISHAVLNNALTGRAWPSALTVSRMEVGLDADLWPPNRLVTTHATPEQT
jgi:hypothetical protein